MAINEKRIQAYLMVNLMDKLNHILIAPNITNVYRWECDLLSVTRALYAHEFEIKISLSDYRREFIEKKWKHSILRAPSLRLYNLRPISPNYYWMVSSFDISSELPDYAGWIQVNDLGDRLDLWVKKAAPRLQSSKMTEKQQDSITRVISYRIKDLWYDRFGGSNGQKEKA